MSAGAPLWRMEELLAACGGQADGSVAAEGAIAGVSIDSRSIEPGDLFVALKDQRDGHEFVPMAFEKGAAAALVSRQYQRSKKDGLLIRVDDPLAGLESIAAAARERLQPGARVIAVTGSAGKTTTKEMLRVCLAAIGKTHASVKSYNNHWGVPLTLARMPRDVRFAVIEIGMNHPGEIRPLSKLARPHVALITTIAPAHIGQFKSLDEIAEAKAEIFEGLEEGGLLVLPRDVPQFALLRERAAGRGQRFIGFGQSADADLRLDPQSLELDADGSRGSILIDGGSVEFGLPLPGLHNAGNLTACVGAIWAAGGDAAQSRDWVGTGLKAIASLQLDPTGRGQVFELKDGITLIDESYNANPASMRAALATLALYPRGRRRVVIFGDMLELGDAATRIHLDLATDIVAADVDTLFACGPQMKHLFDTLPADKRGAYAGDAGALTPLVLQGLRKGDVVMIKASNGSRLGPLAAAVRKALAPLAEQAETTN